MSIVRATSRRKYARAIPRMRYEAVIVGAGIGGLSAAALLARAGMRVLLLDAMHYPGGCASSYEKSGAVFDVGATTFSGIAPGQPLADMFDRIGHFDALLPADPPMGVFIDGVHIVRHRDRDAWIHEAECAFERPMEGFWNEVASYSDAAYALMSTVPYLPPQSIRETGVNIRYLRPVLLRHLPHLFSTIERRIRSHGADSVRFRRFIDAQLLITSQGSAARVPFFAGALGLSYPDYPVYSVRGGMLRYARFLESCATDAGADVAYLQRVTSIERSEAGWTLRTRGGATVEADAVITNLPVFNLPALTTGAVRAHFARAVEGLRRSGVRPWAAYTIYALVDATFAADLPINMQVVLPVPLFHTGSTTLFLSFSHPDDTERAPSGFRTLTISTHLPASHPVMREGQEQYRRWKNLAEEEIMLALRTHVPEFSDMSFHFSQSGTPRTFEKYTGRADGMVGGIPLDRRVFPFRYPRPSTPFGGLYCIGDTFFPGQGIPGVTLGAMSVARRMGIPA